MIVKEKVLISLPVLYSEIIYDNLTPECRNRTEFIIKAIEEKFERCRIEFEHKDKTSFEGDVEDMPLIYNLSRR